MPLESSQTVRKRLQKRHNVTLVLGRKPKIADQSSYILRRFRRRPATHFLARRTLSTARLRLRRVAEVHPLSKTLQIPVMHVGLYEIRARPPVDVTQCGHLELPVVQRRQGLPLQRVRVIRTAQHGAHSQIEEVEAQRIGGESVLVRLRL